MAIKNYKPTSPARRNMSVTDYSVLSKNVEPEKSLLAPLNKKSGRNSYGRITVRHRGGGNRRKYRVIDFKRRNFGVVGIVKTLEYDPNRSAHIALVEYEDGTKSYIIAPVGLKVGYKVVSGPDAAGQYPRRYFRTQRRAVSRQGCPAGEKCRQHGTAHGERKRYGTAQTAFRRAAECSRKLHGYDRSGQQH